MCTPGAFLDLLPIADDKAAVGHADRLVWCDREREERLALASGIERAHVTDIPKLCAGGVTYSVGDECPIAATFGIVFWPRFFRVEIGWHMKVGQPHVGYIDMGSRARWLEIHAGIPASVSTGLAASWVGVGRPLIPKRLGCDWAD